MTDPFGCTLATGRLDREGYAFAGKTRAHIAAWIEAEGAIPDGMELDHTCRRRACINVRHLELVTRSENERRKSWRWRTRIKQCRFGHSMDDAMVTPEGGRVCRTCRKEQETK